LTLPGDVPMARCASRLCREELEGRGDGLDHHIDVIIGATLQITCTQDVTAFLKGFKEA